MKKNKLETKIVDLKSGNIPEDIRREKVTIIYPNGNTRDELVTHYFKDQSGKINSLLTIYRSKENEEAYIGRRVYEIRKGSLRDMGQYSYWMENGKKDSDLGNWNYNRLNHLLKENQL